VHEFVAVPVKFNPAALEDFESRFLYALGNEKCKVIVLVGSSSYFSIGMDLTYISSAYGAGFVSQLSDILKMVKKSHKPVLARIDGNVIAGGMALLGVADFVLSSETATFSLPEAKFGIAPTIAMASLLERVRPHYLKHLVWNPGVISAKQACEWGIVDQTVQPENLDQEINALAHKLSRLPASVISESKALLAEHGCYEAMLDFGCQILESKLADPQAIAKISRYLEDISLFNDEYAGG
jgi:enoyl-CoA hydratase/carnithine racemase